MKEKNFKRNNGGGGGLLSGIVITLSVTAASLFSGFLARGVINFVTRTDRWKKKIYPRIKRFVLGAERFRDSFLRSFKKKRK